MSNIFIISGPSGAGEDSVIEGLKKILPVEKIITSTTREMRSGETHGLNYYYLSEKEFEDKIRNDELAEWTREYNDNLYGVTKTELARVERSGKIGLWKIEYKGVISAKTKFPYMRSIYIAPPSLEILRKRIIRRDPTVTEKYLDERMEYTKEWTRHEDIYDYKVVNEEGKLEETVKKVAEIIASEMSKAEV